MECSLIQGRNRIVVENEIVMKLIYIIASPTVRALTWVPFYYWL